jgi:hypothetical protein
MFIAAECAAAKRSSMQHLGHANTGYASAGLYGLFQRAIEVMGRHALITES